MCISLFQIIDRFSEDLDVLLDIRRIIPDLIVTTQVVVLLKRLRSSE